MVLDDGETSVVGSVVIAASSVLEFSSNCLTGKVTELFDSGVSEMLSLGLDLLLD